MIAVTALASIGISIGAFWVLGMARLGSGVLVIANGAIAAMRDKTLDDDVREKTVQRASIQLIGAFFRSWF